MRVISKYLMFTALLFLLSGQVFAADKAKVDEPAPDFTLQDSNGKTHKLSDYKGKYVVLEWINFGCPFVQKHYNSKNMQTLQKKYTDKDVVWLTICSSAEGKQGYMAGNDEINEKLKDVGFNASSYLLDSEGDVGKMYNAKTTPHMYVINKEGVLVYAGGIDDINSTDIDDIKKATNYVDLTFKALEANKEVNPSLTQSYGCSVKYK